MNTSPRPNTSPHIPVVTVLGSCRVYVPLQRMEEQGLIRINNTGVFGYVHYTKEVIQQLRIIRGEVEIPWELKPYVTHKVMPKNYRSTLGTVVNDFAETEFFFCEISSMRELIYRGIYLQINRVRDQIVQDDESLMRWWKDLQLNKVANDREVYIRECARKLSDTEKDVILHLEVELQTRETVLADMRIIAELIGKPIIFVTHINLPGKDGNLIEVRVNLMEYVIAGAKALGMQVFNPSETISFYGREKALQDEGRDLTHYTESFERYLGKSMYQLFIKPAMETKAASSA